MVAGYIPWRFYGLSHVHVEVTNPLTILALLLIAAGVVLLLACIWEFAARGKGTLSPLDPTKELVVQGLYRYVRNPMYLSVSTIVLGGALLARSRGLVVYWAIFLSSSICSCDCTRNRRCGANLASPTSATSGRWDDGRRGSEREIAHQ